MTIGVYFFLKEFDWFKLHVGSSCCPKILIDFSQQEHLFCEQNALSALHTLLSSRLHCTLCQVGVRVRCDP